MLLHMCLGDMLTFIKSYFFKKKSDATVIVIDQVHKMEKNGGGEGRGGEGRSGEGEESDVA